MLMFLALKYKNCFYSDNTSYLIYHGLPCLIGGRGIGDSWDFVPNPTSFFAIAAKNEARKI
jgi:hypothetical protein